MLGNLKNILRRRIRGFQRAGQYPLLLPHHRLTSTGLQTVNGDQISLPPPLKAALALCNGQQTLASVSKQANLSSADLIKAQDDGLILIWHSPIPAAAPQPHAHSIIVSPHPDDAALSCGGRMLGDQSMLVLNIFSQAAWWRFKHSAEDFPKILACRRTEEELVARLSGATIKNLDLPEALLRGYQIENVFGESKNSPADASAAETIRQQITLHAKQHPLAHWFLPLGIGNHIDHRIARDAALDVLRALNIKPTHLHFYEDLPYAAKLGPTADFSKHLPNQTLRAESLEIEDQLPWKLELLRAYWSQFRWADLAELRTYAIAVGSDGPAEITWTAATV